MSAPTNFAGNKKIATLYTIRQLDTTVCNRIISGIDQSGWLSSLISRGDVSEVDKRFRSCSEQKLLPQDGQFPFSLLADMIDQINQETWQFDISGFDLAGDHPSVFKYSAEQDDHFDWHFDVTASAPTRKLGFTLQLSAPSEYEGGQLEFFGVPGSSALREKGTLIVFPSYVWHRVKPVTEGTRMVLVGWLHGNSFR